MQLLQQAVPYGVNYSCPFHTLGSLFDNSHDALVIPPIDHDAFDATIHGVRNDNARLMRGNVLDRRRTQQPLMVESYRTDDCHVLVRQRVCRVQRPPDADFDHCDSYSGECEGKECGSSLYFEGSGFNAESGAEGLDV